MPVIDPSPALMRHPPTLYGIIAIKLGKSVMLFLLAFGVYTLADEDLPKEFRELLTSINLDPGGQFFAALGERLQRITPSNVYWVATGTFLYGLLSLVEGGGLIFRLSWAGWLVVSEGGFFIPLEVYNLLKKFSWSVFIILLINIGIVWYVLQNRHRLFRHIHRHQQGR